MADLDKKDPRLNAWAERDRTGKRGASIDKELRKEAKEDGAWLLLDLVE